LTWIVRGVLAVVFGFNPVWAFADLIELPPVLLQTHVHPPYQVMESSGLSGRTPETLACVFNKLDRDYAIAVAPRKRNRALVKSGKADGFFLSIPDPELDTYSISTHPLALERWSFYSLRDGRFAPKPDGSSVGVILGSNEQYWLMQRNIPAVSVGSQEALVRMLIAGRVSHVLADDKAFADAVRRQGAYQMAFQTHFVRYVPLVAYFSKDFTSRNPGVIGHFNRALDNCLTDEVHPTKQDLRRLWVLINQYRKDAAIRESLADDIILAATVKVGHDGRDALDRRWIAAVAAGRSLDEIDQLLASPLSQKLRDIAERSEGRIAEIFAFDFAGDTVGVNKPTSDYWQGDEAPYRALFEKGESVHISEIQFDQSTRKFQIKVTLPVVDEATGRKVGGITFGFDADLALSVND